MVEYHVCAVTRKHPTHKGRGREAKTLCTRFLLLTDAVLLAFVVGEVTTVLYGAATVAVAVPLTRAIELLGEASADLVE